MKTKQKIIAFLIGLAVFGFAAAPRPAQAFGWGDFGNAVYSLPQTIANWFGGLFSDIFGKKDAKPTPIVENDPAMTREVANETEAEKNEITNDCGDGKCEIKASGDLMDGIVINAGKNEYKIGEIVGITIKNNLDKSVWYWDNRARIVPLAGIQIYKNGGWAEVERKSACACKKDCITLAAGWMELPPKSVVEDSWETKEDCFGKTESGKYRFWFSYSTDSTGQINPVNFPKVYSNEFAVVAASERGISCGNRVCETGETAENCAKDCGFPTDCLDAAARNENNHSNWPEYKSEEIGVSFKHPADCVFAGDYGDWGRVTWFNCGQLNLSIAAKNYNPYLRGLASDKIVDVDWSAKDFFSNMEIKKSGYGQNEILFVKKLSSKSLLVAEYAAIEGSDFLDLFVASPLNANYPNLNIYIKFPFERDLAIKEYIELAEAKGLDASVPIQVYKKIAQKIEAGDYSKELACRIEAARQIADSAVVFSDGKINEFISYQWQGINFKYPENWQVEEILYQTPAQEAVGLAKENIGVKIYKDKSSGADFIAIGGRQVSCDLSEGHVLCSYIQSAANYIYTDSKIPGILNLFEKIRNSITVCGDGKCDFGETNCSKDCK